MRKNTYVSLDEHFQAFVKKSITDGSYQNESEVIKAGLRLLEQEEEKNNALKSAIQDGLLSGTALDFDPLVNLQKLKSKNM